MRIETLETCGFSTRYFRFGEGARPLVILPGISVQRVAEANTARAVAEAYAAFGEAFTVYVPDRRDVPQEPYPVAEMARDTAAVLSALGLGRISLFGVSQGGMIALTLAAAQPDLIEKLALGSTCAYLSPGAEKTLDTWVRTAERGDAESLYLAFGRAVYPPAALERARAALTAAAANVTPADLERFRILAAGTKGFDLRGGLSAIRCPALVLGAEDDGVLGPDAAGELFAEFAGNPAAALHTFRGYGHAAYDLAPDYKERLLRFFL